MIQDGLFFGGWFTLNGVYSFPLTDTSFCFYTITVMGFTLICSGGFAWFYKVKESW